MPQPPPQHNPSSSSLNHANKTPATTSSSSTLPDLILTALSFVFLFSTTTTATKSISIAPRFLQLPQFKLLRNPRMSSPNTINSRQKFSNPQALSDWLKPRMPSDSFSAWGVNPGTKNVHNLWLELAAGETSLADSTPPIRTVQVVTVRVIDKQNRVLIESHQLLSDGTIRPRNMPLSEKMKPGETVEFAVARAIKEELGSILYNGVAEEERSDVVKVVPDSYTERVEERVSNSYPGLPARYVLHTVDARVDCLPEGEFWTEEHEEYEECGERSLADMAVGVKRHYWKWVDADKV